MAASAGQNAQIWSDLHSLGLNDVGAAGVMGNMSQESSMDPTTPGGGLMQWIGGRWTALVNFARAHGLDPNSEKAQVGYFGQELQAGNEGITLQGLNSQGTPAAAALYVSENYERPAAWAANNSNREGQATNFYNSFTGSNAPTPGAGLPGYAYTQAGNKTADTPTAASYPTGTDIIDEINKSLTIQKFDVMHPVNSLAEDAGAISLRIVLVLIGLILLIFGLVAITEKATGGAVPVPV